MTKTKVTMNLFDRDVQNTEYLTKILSAQSKAHTVSISLSLTRFLVDEILDGAEVVLRQKNGDYERVRMTELEGIRERHHSSAQSEYSNHGVAAG